MIRAQNLSKYYGAKRALGPVSFEIDDGETVGFLGLNGAGKTTALRIFACDLRPSSGTVVVGDIDAVKSPHEVRKRIGFLPESPPLYTDMVVRDFITFAAKLRGMSSSQIKRRLPEVVDLTNLEDVETDIIGTLSHGFRQRVGVAQAIMHEPKLLILDEPTRGLDPVQIVEMRSMINDLKEKHTVLISSHILTEISETCDRMLVLGKGRILASGDEAQLSSKMASTRRLLVVVQPGGSTPYRAEDHHEIAKLIEDIDGVTSVSVGKAEGDAREYAVTASTDVRARICRSLVEADHDVLQLSPAERELENIFLNLVQPSSKKQAKAFEKALDGGRPEKHAKAVAEDESEDTAADSAGDEVEASADEVEASADEVEASAGEVEASADEVEASAGDEAEAADDEAEAADDEPDEDEPDEDESDEHESDEEEPDEDEPDEDNEDEEEEAKG